MKNWLDLSYNKAGLWTTGDHFVLLFDNLIDRALAAQKFKDQSEQFGGYPREIKMESHGRFPALFIPRELTFTPKAITAAFDLAGRTQIENIDDAVMLPPPESCISYNPFAWVSLVEAPWSMIDLEGQAFSEIPKGDLYTAFKTPEDQSSDEPDLPRRVLTNDLDLAGMIDYDGHHPLFRVSPKHVLRRPAAAADWIAASESLKDLYRQADIFKQIESVDDSVDVSGWHKAIRNLMPAVTLMRLRMRPLRDPDVSMAQSAGASFRLCLTEAVGAFIRIRHGGNPTQIETVRKAADAFSAEAARQGELEQNPQLAKIINNLIEDIEKIERGESLCDLAHAVFQAHYIFPEDADYKNIMKDSALPVGVPEPKAEPVEIISETVYSEGSSSDKIEDFGVEIRGARKHYYASASAAIIAAMTNDELSALKSTSTGGAIRRDSLWRTIDVRAEVEEHGRDPRMTLLRKAVQQGFANSYESVAYRRGRYHHIPKGYDAEYGVRFYMTAIAVARDAMSVSDEELAYRWNETIEKENVTEKERRAKNGYGGRNIGGVFIEDWIVGPTKEALQPRFGKELDFVSNSYLTSLLAKKGNFDWNLGLALSSIETTPDASLAAKVQDHPMTRKKAPSAKKVKPSKDAATDENAGSTDSETATVADHLNRVERLNLPDWRNGKAISTPEFLEVFGFRGGQFGNWVPNKERQTWLDMSADAMYDLANYVGIAPKHIGFDGRLGMAWGARGRSRAAAHFEPGLNVVNFTRKAGAGAMSHEWAHALDHWLYKASGMETGFMTPFVSDTITTNRYTTSFFNGLNPPPEYAHAKQEIADVLGAVHNVMSAIRAPINLNNDESLVAVDRRALNYKKKYAPKVFFNDSAWSMALHIDQFAREKPDLIDCDAMIEIGHSSLVQNNTAAVMSGMLIRDITPLHQNFSISDELKASFKTSLLLDTIIFKKEVTIEKRKALFKEIIHGDNPAHALLRSGMDHCIGRVRQLGTFMVNNRRYFANKGSQFLYDAQHETGFGGPKYWAAGHELFARAFESVLAYSFRKNEQRSDFLANKDGGPLPVHDFEMEEIKHKMDVFIRRLQDLMIVLDNKPEESPVDESDISSVNTDNDMKMAASQGQC